MPIERPLSSSRDSEPGFLGEWYGPRCDERDYSRKLELRADGTFEATDLVAPCPKDARCTWSGIVNRSGTWRLDRGMIVLEAHKPISRAEPLPQLVRWEQSQGMLLEVVVGGPMTCEYRRQ